MFPLNIILNSGEEQRWQNEYYAYYNYDPATIQQFTELFSKIIMPTQKVRYAGYSARQRNSERGSVSGF